MVVIHRFDSYVHWFSILPIGSEIPQIDKDFVGTNENGDSPPLYYVSDDEKLYILLETPIPNKHSQQFSLFYEISLTYKILNYDQIEVKQTDSNMFQISDCFYMESVWKPAIRNVKDVLDELPESRKMPDHIRELFINKYITSRGL
nr:hypothetical protein [Abalone asfa-like virus]